jgi:hypothetical protein
MIEFFNKTFRGLQVRAAVEFKPTRIEITTNTGYRMTVPGCYCGKTDGSCNGWHETRAIDFCLRLLDSKKPSRPHTVGAPKIWNASNMIWKDGGHKEAYAPVGYWPVVYANGAACRGDGKESPTDYGYNIHKLIEGQA